MTTESERSLLRVLISNCSVELKSEFQVDNGSLNILYVRLKKLLGREYPVEVIGNCVWNV